MRSRSSARCGCRSGRHESALSSLHLASLLLALSDQLRRPFIISSLIHLPHRSLARRRRTLTLMKRRNRAKIRVAAGLPEPTYRKPLKAVSIVASTRPCRTAGLLVLPAMLSWPFPPTCVMSLTSTKGSFLARASRLGRSWPPRMEPQRCLLLLLCMWLAPLPHSMLRRQLAWEPCPLP